MIGEMGGLLGLVVLILDIWAIVSVARANAGGGAKALWIIAIIFLPVVGFIAWLIFGPKGP